VSRVLAARVAVLETVGPVITYAEEAAFCAALDALIREARAKALEEAAEAQAASVTEWRGDRESKARRQTVEAADAIATWLRDRAAKERTRSEP